jgi:hypothetical protein
MREIKVSTDCLFWFGIAISKYRTWFDRALQSVLFTVIPQKPLDKAKRSCYFISVMQGQITQTPKEKPDPLERVFLLLDFFLSSFYTPVRSGSKNPCITRHWGRSSRYSKKTK